MNILLAVVVASIALLAFNIAHKLGQYKAAHVILEALREAGLRDKLEEVMREMKEKVKND